MRKCPIKTCRHDIPDRMFVCAHHWKRLAPTTRDYVSNLFRDYLDDEISLDELRHSTDRVLADFQGISVEEAGDHPVTAAVRTCRCGKVLVCGMEEDEKGVSVVIGGKVMSATGKHPIYTRFSRHCCPTSGVHSRRMILQRSLQAPQQRCKDGNTPKAP